MEEQRLLGVCDDSKKGDIGPLCEALYTLITLWCQHTAALRCLPLALAAFLPQHPRALIGRRHTGKRAIGPFAEKGTPKQAESPFGGEAGEGDQPPLQQPPLKERLLCKGNNSRHRKPSIRVPWQITWYVH